MAVDDATGSLLDLIESDRIHADDREAVRLAILAAAFDDDGRIDPNLVRTSLPAWVRPQIIGPTYRAMCLEGVIEPDGWTTSTDSHGRNYGKPARTYRMAS